MLAVQHLGESANELLQAWRPTNTYLYGQPDFMAVQQSIRPFNFDRTRVYSGVIGYKDRLNMFDPNLMIDNPGPAGAWSHPGGVGLGDNFGGMFDSIGSSAGKIAGGIVLAALGVMLLRAAL